MSTLRLQLLLLKVNGAIQLLVDIRLRYVGIDAIALNFLRFALHASSQCSADPKLTNGNAGF